jgi:hypothetical protein
MNMIPAPLAGLGAARVRREAYVQAAFGYPHVTHSLVNAEIAVTAVGVRYKIRK